MILLTLPEVGQELYCTWPEGPTKIVTVISLWGNWVTIEPGKDGPRGTIPFDWLHTEPGDFDHTQ